MITATSTPLEQVRKVVTGLPVQRVEMVAEGVLVEAGRRYAIVTPDVTEGLWTLKLDGNPAAAGPFEHVADVLARTVTSW